MSNIVLSLVIISIYIYDLSERHKSSFLIKINQNKSQRPEYHCSSSNHNVLGLINHIVSADEEYVLDILSSDVRTTKQLC